MARLQAVLQAEDGDPRRVLADEAVALADSLAAIAASDDVQAWHVVATLRWWRYQQLPQGEDQDELMAALAAFVQVLPYAPHLVPEQVRQFLFDHLELVAGVDSVLGEAGDSPAALNAQAIRLLQDRRSGKDLAALGRAVAWLQQAVDATPTGHPNRAGYLSNLGGAPRTRFKRCGNLADLDQAAHAYDDALNTPTAPAMIRIQAGRNTAGIAADHGNWTAAETRINTVLELLPALTGHGLRPQDRQYHLSLDPRMRPAVATF